MAVGVVAAIAIVAFAAGVGLTAALVMFAARRFMLLEHESKHDYEETVRRLRETVENTEGWGFPVDSWNFSESLANRGVPVTGVDRVRIFFVCRAAYAREMVDDQANTTAIMPCAWAVYERNGKTYLASMNIPLMASVFGGVQKRVFTLVGREEKEMLDRILH